MTPHRPDMARNAAAKRCYSELRRGTLKPASATPEQLRLALTHANRVNDFETVATIEFAFDASQTPVGPNTRGGG